jgi:hypothetical protein
MQYINAIIQLIPIFKKLLDLFIQSPEEKRLKLISDLHDAFNKAKDSGGDTSFIEDLIRKGKK